MSANFGVEEVFQCLDCEDFSKGIALKVTHYIFYFWTSGLISSTIVFVVEKSLAYLKKCPYTAAIIYYIQHCLFHPKTE